MAPASPLPHSDEFPDSEDYVESLLKFANSSNLFQILCGGVHILDFFTREPDLYATVLPQSWREWFQGHGVEDVLDLLMRENLDQFAAAGSGEREPNPTKASWRGGLSPPESLLCYTRDIQRHLLRRSFRAASPAGNPGPKNAKKDSLTRKIAVGMKPKKIHEVQNFAQYIDNLASEISRDSARRITHLVDFGSGQNYLGRVLASPPYSRHIVAVESKRHNIEGAKSMDVTARLAEKGKVMRHKREYRNRTGASNPEETLDRHLDYRSEGATAIGAAQINRALSWEEVEAPGPDRKEEGSIQYVEHIISGPDLSPVVGQIKNISQTATNPCRIQRQSPGRSGGPYDSSSIQGLGPPSSPSINAHRAEPLDTPELGNGDTRIIPRHQQSHAVTSTVASLPQSLMIISLHSCGNLVHHALRSFILTPSVTAVAVIGCCYNLMTERLGPPTYKLPTLRPRPNPRVEATSAAHDPAGFPMSERLATYLHEHGEGVRLNITARMMAVQAPQNWTPVDSADFFTRHFFRALLQRIFLDHRVVSAPSAPDDIVGGHPSCPGAMGTEPIIIGSLRKACYTSFIAYVRGAVTKLSNSDPVRGPIIASLISSLSDDEIADYHSRYLPRKKDLSIVWSLMAFSAGVVEAIVVVDRWLFLKEQQDVVKDAWVEAVFDYQRSPRNLVVVGVKNCS
ncbi:MAG: hypothetical protein M1840_009096 [Geoglossum simile]|nr:MAG: hypothetical protein M1840_009096 [Geoglossum simile]